MTQDLARCIDVYSIFHIWRTSKQPKRDWDFSGNVSILGSFVAEFKINFPGKERIPWERGCPVYNRPQDHLRFEDGGAV